MPASKPLRITHPAQQARKSKKPRARVDPRGEVVGPVCCPSCDHELPPPVYASSVAVGEVVLREWLEYGREPSATRVASLNGLSRNWVAMMLRRACEQGVLRRLKTTMPTGSYEYRYYPDPKLLAYLQSPTLRAQFRSTLKSHG